MTACGFALEHIFFNNIIIQYKIYILINEKSVTKWLVGSLFLSIIIIESDYVIDV